MTTTITKPLFSDPNTSYYSPKELTKTARQLAKNCICPECGRNLKLHEWEIAINDRTRLYVTAKCVWHTEYRYYTGMAL